MRHIKCLTAAVAAAAALVAVAAWPVQSRSEDRTHRSLQAKRAAAAAGSASARSGTAQLAADDAQVLNPGLMRLFDYYLSAADEVSVDDICLEAEDELDRRFRPDAAAYAKHILAQYLGYRQALSELEKSSARDPASARRLHQMRLELRLRFFTPAESAALFAADRAVDEQ